ncbi:hypothetical protein Y88_1025 [Novosphingobium nitrogenifigens DSM 19370]|uniref:Uncharacterized protein n=1 Tax=Novosphingobium nitrogenifigens DSM 19370 TaxID=983920 RepID=F1Z916_9SPHN|nr:hypothetical protein Y88_1025 [Novosphingobium nitrogenifigens DSM 19370]
MQHGMGSFLPRTRPCPQAHKWCHRGGKARIWAPLRRQQRPRPLQGGLAPCRALTPNS